MGVLVFGQEKGKGEIGEKIHVMVKFASFSDADEFRFVLQVRKRRVQLLNAMTHSSDRTGINDAGTYSGEQHTRSGVI